MTIRSALAWTLALALAATMAPAVSFASEEAQARYCPVIDDGTVDPVGAAICYAEQCGFGYTTVETPGKAPDVRAPSEAYCTLSGASPSTAAYICQLDPTDPLAYVQCEMDRCSIVWKDVTVGKYVTVRVPVGVICLQ